MKGSDRNFKAYRQKDKERQRKTEEEVDRRPVVAPGAGVRWRGSSTGAPGAGLRMAFARIRPRRVLRLHVALQFATKIVVGKNKIILYTS